MSQRSQEHREAQDRVDLLFEGAFKRQVIAVPAISVATRRQDTMAFIAPVVALRLAFVWDVFPGTCVPGYTMPSRRDSHEKPEGNTCGV